MNVLPDRFATGLFLPLWLLVLLAAPLFPAGPGSGEPEAAVALLAPGEAETARLVAEKLRDRLARQFRMIDRELGGTAFRSFAYQNPFNLSQNEAINLGAAIGCRYFLLIRADVQRRASLEKDDFFEAYAAVYTVSSRTGRLIDWRLVSFASPEFERAEKGLLELIGPAAVEISGKINKTRVSEAAEARRRRQRPEEIPAENTPAAAGFQPPLPFRRLRPQYPDLARLYGIEAIVDIEIEVSETGQIERTDVVRWAGFGLDEAVTKTVLEMNWRPASRNGKTLPVRAVLRYNFRNVENK